MARKGGTPENLIPAKKGEVRNPKGRTPVLPELKAAIAKCLADEKDGLTALDAILLALRARAMKGDVRAAQELLDRGFGKSLNNIDLKSSDGSMTPTQTIITTLTENEFKERLKK